MKLIKILMLGIFSLFLIACQVEEASNNQAEALPIVKKPLRRSESLLHTVVQISIYHEGQEAVMDEAITKIKDLEALLSPSIEGSDIYKINQAAGKEAVKVDPKTFELIKTSIEISEESQGKFDISIGVITNLWKIGSEQARKPSDQEIQAALPFVDYRKITLDEDKQTVKIEEGMSLELGAISKGYIADQIRQLFIDRGVTTAIINLGGNVIVMGTSPNNTDGWQVGIQDPDQTRGVTVGTVPSSDRSVVTSGIYERYLQEGDDIYHHIMDPRTGYPVGNNISGVTVFTNSSTQGDALSTLLFIYGIEDGLDYVNQQPDIEAVYIDKAHGIHLSQGLEDSFEISNEEYHLVKQQN